MTARKCARELVQREGARGLWKGMTQQFIAAVPGMSVMFFVMDQTKSALKDHKYGANMDNVSLGMYSGAVAGGARVFVLVPFDLLKTRAQAQKNGKVRYTRMISTMYRQQGLTGLYRGFWTVALRDVPACAAYFFTFEKLK
jgi:predicted xylose isomerase-like sugar epimerase